MAGAIPKATTVSPRPPLVRRLYESERVRCIITVALLGSTIITLLWCIATYDGR